MSSKSFFIATFGCRTNQADSAAIREDFAGRGYQEIEDWSGADVIVVNSCTVTHRSDQQVRQLVRRLRRGNPRAGLFITGCYAQRDPLALARITGVDGVIGNTHKSSLVTIAAEPDSIGPNHHRDLAAVYRADFSRDRAMEFSQAVRSGGRTRPFVKIQDGCDARCSYCIIPAVRGPSRSVPPQQILEQIRELALQGYQEVVLTGIHIGTYGLHFHPRYTLHRLLEEILEIRELAQLRISSIEPMELSRRVIRLAAGSGGRIAPHFHICLQSGSDRILKKMLRPYSTQRFAEIVHQARELLPDSGIGTDVIAGFPGETEADHEATMEFVARLPFTYLHVFPYSARLGTRAADMTDPVEPDTINRRSKDLRQLSGTKNRRFRRLFIGRRLRVVTLEECKQGRRSAVSGNYLKVQLDQAVPGNQILEVEILGSGSGALQGRPVARA